MSRDFRKKLDKELKLELLTSPLVPADIVCQGVSDHVILMWALIRGKQVHLVKRGLVSIKEIAIFTILFFTFSESNG